MSRAPRSAIQGYKIDFVFYQGDAAGKPSYTYNKTAFVTALNIDDAMATVRATYPDNSVEFIGVHRSNSTYNEYLITDGAAHVLIARAAGAAPSEPQP